MTENRLLYGFDEAPPNTHALSSGPFSILYENGALRYIKYGENEIIRIIYISLRDKNWGTYSPIIENEKIISSENSFKIEYTCRYQGNNKTIFTWNAVITGDENGKIVFTAHGETITDLFKNRSGFCVLHPIKNTAGETLIVIHSDLSEEKISFPKSIAPFVPASDITKLRWINSGHEYAIEMKGEIFEMEDHRNWTDTSFKSYCTPLSIPFPVQLKKGDTIDQEIIFYPLNNLPPIKNKNETEINLTIDESSVNTFPLIGTEASTDIADLPDPCREFLKKIQFDYYGIEVSPSMAEWETNFLKQIHITNSISIDLFIKLKLGDEYEKEFSAFIEILTKNEIVPKWLLLIGRNHHFTPQSMIDWIPAKIKKDFPSIQIGIGTETNFTELNRNRRKPGNIDFVSYAIHPQEHAFDNLSLIENLESQYDTVRAAKEIYPGKKVFISPVTLRRRINPYAHDIKDREWSNEQKNDPRQISLWNAGWVLGSIKYLAESGASGVSYFQTAGKQGVIDKNGNSYPVAVLLQCLSRFKNAFALNSSVNDSLACSSLLIKENNKKYLLLANHTNKSIQINLPFEIDRVEKLNVYPASIQISSSEKINKIELKPFEVAMCQVCSK